MLRVASLRSWKRAIWLRMSSGRLLSGVALTRMTFLPAWPPPGISRCVGVLQMRWRLVKCLGRVVSEFVGFVNDDQIESFRVLDFVKAAVGHELDVVEPEEFHRPFPVVPDGWGNDDERMRTVFREAVVPAEAGSFSASAVTG